MCQARTRRHSTSQLLAARAVPCALMPIRTISYEYILLVQLVCSTKGTRAKLVDTEQRLVTVTGGEKLGSQGTRDPEFYSYAPEDYGLDDAYL